MEDILNRQFLCVPPFSLINIPSNLIPIYLNSQLNDLLEIISEYESTQDIQKILDLSIINLEGPDEKNFYWHLVCTNEIWARRLYMLID